jgi:hypothetical protein
MTEAQLYHDSTVSVSKQQHLPVYDTHVTATRHYWLSKLPIELALLTSRDDLCPGRLRCRG